LSVCVEIQHLLDYLLLSWLISYFSGLECGARWRI